MSASEDGRAQLQALYRNVSSSGQNVPGSPPYWWRRKDDLAALTRAEHYESNALPIAFTTASMAEYFWPEVRLLLHNEFLKLVH